MDIGKYRNNQNWNIGFCEITPAELVKRKCLTSVHWLKHDFHDRFFADPFILREDDDSIYVLVEEMKFHTKGVISLLVVDRRSFVLRDRRILLEHDTHLSYPAIYRHNGKIYVYPENYSSGQLNLYELDPDDFSLRLVRRLLDMPLTDATVFRGADGRLYMISTLSSNSRDNAFLYVNDAMTEGFTLASPSPVVTGRDRSRCGGSLFEADGTLYRPVQNCSRRYGGSLKVMEVLKCEEGKYSEKELFELKPHSWRYNLGLHTLNFSPCGTVAVIDGYGYLYPFMGRAMNMASLLYHRFKGDGVPLS